MTAAPPPPATAATTALPREVALVCVLSESLLVRQRWTDLFGQGGFVGRILDRIAAQASGSSVGGSNVRSPFVRLSLVLADLAQTDPSRSPVSHKQYFLPPSQFFPPLSLRPPASTPLGRFCAGADDSELGLLGAGLCGLDTDGAESHGLLEAIVAALELFTHHQSRPFPSSTFSDLPLPTFTPIPNTTPLNLPPLPPSAAASPYPGRGPAAPAPARGAIERHLLVITDGGLRTGDDPAEVRWNEEQRFDGLQWANVGQALSELEVRASVLLLGEAKGAAPVVDGKLQALVTPAGKPAGSPWFPTLDTDRFLLAPSLAPPSVKRPLPSPSKREDAAIKKPRMSPGSAGLSSLPSLSIPAGTSTSGSTTPGGPPPSVAVTQPPQVKREPQAAQPPRAPPPPLQTAPNAAAVARPPMRSTPTIVPPPPSSNLASGRTQGPPPSPVRPPMQRSPLQPSRPALVPGAQPGGALPAGQGPQNKAEQKQASSELLARLQARQGQLAGAGGPPSQGQPPQGAPPQQQVKMPQGSQNHALQQQQQRPMPVQGQPQPTKTPVWQGEVSWTVHSAGPKGGGNVLGCQVIGYAAHPIALEEFQAKTWPNRLHLSAVSPLQMNEIKRLVTSGRMPCITLATFHKAGTSQEDRQRGEQSYNSLARNLDSKKTMGHIRFGPPGCGMVIFATSSGPGQPPKLMAMCFLKSPIPFPTTPAQQPQQPQGQPQQPKALGQQQQQQQQYLAQAPQAQNGQMPQPLRANAPLQQQAYPQQVQSAYPQQLQPPIQQQQTQGGGLGVNMTQAQIAAILAAHQQSQQGGGGWP